MISCSIEPLESLPPSPVVESDRKEDIAVDNSTFESWRKKKGKPKARKHKSKQGSKKTMNNDPKLNVHSIYRGDGLFGNWRELKRCPKILHHNVPPLTHDLYSNMYPLRT